MSFSAADVGSDDEFQRAHSGKLYGEVLSLMDGGWRTEIPLLAHDFMGLSRFGHPSQDKLLCAGRLVLLECQLNALDILGLIEDEPYSLRAGFRRAPSTFVFPQQGAFDRMLRILGSHFHRGRSVQLQPLGFGDRRDLPDRADQALA